MRRWIPAIIILLALVGSGFFLIRPTPKLGSFTMSDGTVVEVVKITTGPVHRFRYENRWQDIVGSMLPKRFRGGFNPKILEFNTTNAQSLVVWTKSKGRPPGPFGFEIAVADESGVEVPVKRSASSAIRTGFLRNLVFANGWLITPLPKHAREIELGLYERKSSLGHLKLPNPAYRQTRDAQPESLPVAKPVGDVQVRLANISAVKNPQNTNRVDWSINAEVLKEGVVVSDWRLDGLEVLADGELFVERGPEWWLQTMGGDPGPERPPLSPFAGPWPDAVWTLRLWAARRTNFEPAEIWIMKDVPLGNTPEWSIEQHEQRQVGGKEVELRGFRGPSVDQSLSGRSNEVHVSFGAPRRSEGVRITFLNARDDQGRSLGLASRGSGGGSEQSRISYRFSVRHESDAKMVTFQFALHQARSVDFLVKPTFKK